MTIGRLRLNNDLPHLRFESISECPVCGSKDRSATIEDVQDWFFECVGGSWTFAVCGSCASLYLDPRPIKEDLPLAYTSYYTHKASAGGPKAQHFLSSIKQWATNTLINSRFGTCLKPSLPLPLPESLARRCINDRIEARFRYFPKLFPGAKILDVGCGSGKFLRLARNAGWLPFGVDFDSKAVIEAQNANLIVILGDISHAQSLSDSFDGITLNHVIEHVLNIPSTLKIAYHLLKPDGFLHLEYPNPEAAGLVRYGRFWRGLEAPRHICIPSRKAITAALKEVGFARVTFHFDQIDSLNVDAASKSAAIRELGAYVEPEALSVGEPAFLKVIAWR